MLSLLNFNPDGICRVEPSLFECVDLSFMFSSRDYSLAKRYLTYDPEIIQGRQSLFAYILNHAGIVLFLERLSENVVRMAECVSASKSVGSSESNETLYYSFREFGFFTEAIDEICQSLGDCDVPSLKRLYERAKEIQEQPWYVNAKQFTETVDANLRSIKSVTVGINLNAQLMPLEAGIVAIESEPYVTNSLYDKMFSSRIQDKNMICIAPLGLNDIKLGSRELGALNINLYRALNEIMKGSLRKIRGILMNQFQQASSFLLAIDDELRLINMAVRYMLDMKSKGLPLTLPAIEHDCCRIEGLYDPNLLRSKSPQDIVKNDVTFDDAGKIHLVVGVNSGGKSVFLRSIGIAQILFQLGLPIPARNARMVAFHQVMACFSNRIGDKVGGRLENECKQIAKLCENASDACLVLLDEMFSSTNSYDAALLARKTVEWFAVKGTYVVYTTHIHELFSKVDEINQLPNGKSKVDILCADYQNEKVTYRIVKKEYNYESTAVQIFEKYGMDFIL